MQFIYSRFKGEYDPTIGIEFGSKALEIKGYNLKLQIWDTVIFFLNNTHIPAYIKS